MIEGPYKNTRWRDRIAGVEGALLLLQAVGLIALVAAFGLGWLAEGHYLHFGLIYGSGAALLYAYFKTRAPLFLVPLGILCVVAGFLYGN